MSASVGCPNCLMTHTAKGLGTTACILSVFGQILVDRYRG